MTLVPDARGTYSLASDLPLHEIEQLASLPHLVRVSINRTPQLTVALARRLERVRIEHLWLWTRVTPRAMRHVIRIPGLRELDVWRIDAAGRLPDVGAATTLEVLRANHGLRADDLRRIATCASLRELGAQGAELDRDTVSALLAMPSLATLDLESSGFDDAMARRLSRSQTVRALDVGATRVTRAGLAHLARMPQLHALDLWSTNIDVAGLQLLRELPQLEYVSLGTVQDAPALDPTAVTALLMDLPALKRVWLDGVAIDATQQAMLQAKLESLKVS